jgi:hypothetical protein
MDIIQRFRHSLRPSAMKSLQVRIAYDWSVPHFPFNNGLTLIRR